MHNVAHHRDDTDRLYVSRKEAGRGLTTFKIALMNLYNDLKIT